MEQIHLQPFGYSEMYEWENENMQSLARFVTFSQTDPDKIKPYTGEDFILGISTINSLIDSDDPTEWHLKYAINEFGDKMLSKEKLAVASKVYDENLEMSLIRTYPWEHIISVISDKFDNEQQYVPRSSRKEWTRVNILGKCIVEDNGKCTPGEYCMPYNGKIKLKYGTAVPATSDAKHKFYVIKRISNKSILILNK